MCCVAVFAEMCPRCGTEYIRSYEVKGVGLKPTGRDCEKEGCRGKLRDCTLDWDDELPPEELRKAEEAW